MGSRGGQPGRAVEKGSPLAASAPGRHTDTVISSDLATLSWEESKEPHECQ